MEVAIVKIGNSKGIRIAKSVLDQYGIKDAVELILEDEFLILKPIKKVRKGWETAFENMATNNEDQLLIDDVFEDENFMEWD